MMVMVDDKGECGFASYAFLPHYHDQNQLLCSRSIFCPYCVSRCKIELMEELLRSVIIIATRNSRVTRRKKPPFLYRIINDGEN